MNSARILLVILSLINPMTLLAQSSAGSLPPETAQFDFWIGDWDVFTASGQHVGVNRIEKVENGRGLLETWRGDRGSEGRSLNAYNAPKKLWQQYWVGTGVVLELAGGLDGEGRMVLSDRDTRAAGVKPINRITWTPNPDGTVRQHWETSGDEGATWKTAFDGLYRRKAEPSTS